MIIDVVCATINGRSPQGLEFLPEPYHLLQSDESPWAVAANNLLDKTEHDVLHIDDDVQILPGTFDLLEKYYDHADVFGFSLVGWCGNREWIQSAGQMLAPAGDGVWGVGIDNVPLALTRPVYMAH